MDLGKMLNDNPVTDYSWTEAETYEPQGKDLNKVDEISFQSDYDIGPHEDKVDTITTQMKVQSKSSNPETVVYAARILMNQGLSKEAISKHLKFRFKPEELENASSKLGKLFQDEGLVGFVAIDLRSSKGHKKLLEAAKKSPFRKLFKAVLMNPEQLENSTEVTMQRLATSDMELGSIDGLLGDTLTEEVEPYYTPLGLPIVTSASELDMGWIAETMDQVAELDYIGEDDLFDNDVSGLRKAFRTFHANKRKAAKAAPSTEAKDDTDAYSIASSELDAEVSPKLKALGEIEVDPTAKMADTNPGELQRDLDIEEEAYISEDFEGIDQVEVDKEKPRFENIEVNELEVQDKPDIEYDPKQEDLDVNPVNKAIAPEFDVNDAVEVEEDLDVNPVHSKLAPQVEVDDEITFATIDVDELDEKQEVDLGKGPMADLDIDPAGYIDPAFEGHDEIIFEDKDPVDDDLEIDHTASFDW